MSLAIYNKDIGRVGGWEGGRVGGWAFHGFRIRDSPQEGGPKLYTKIDTNPHNMDVYAYFMH